MINITDFAIENNLDKDSFHDYLLDNNWFDGKPKKINGKIIISPSNDEAVLNMLNEYAKTYNYNAKEKQEYIQSKLANAYPDTSKKLDRFVKEYEIDSQSSILLEEFLIYNLAGEIKDSTDREIEDLLECQVNLQLWVKVKKDWRDSDFLLKNFGYNPKDNE